MGHVIYPNVNLYHLATLKFFFTSAVLMLRINMLLTELAIFVHDS